MAPSMRPLSTLLPYLWFLIIITFSSCFCNGICVEREKIALLQFKDDLKYHANRLSSWVGEEDCCKWTGIVCNNLTGHVHEIHLRGHHGCLTSAECEEELMYKLGGKINPSLLNLKQLKYLDLSCNDFEGIQIPSFIGSLGNLRYLNLSRSRFQGMIPPQLGNLTRLRSLSLEGSLEDEPISAKNLQWLSNLSLLHHLDMSVVDLRDASDWLQVINTLPSLVELDLSTCRLNYNTHLTSVNFTSLAVLDLSYNFFSSPIPRWLSSLSNLRHLYLPRNDFNSSIPNWLYNFSRLETLHLGHNNLQGVISSAIGQMISLVSLDLSNNHLTGRIPNSLGNLCNLRQIDLSSNDLGGRVSEILIYFHGCNQDRLESFHFEKTGLFGTLPDPLGEFDNLAYFSLQGNSISGPIPASIGRLTSLQELDLSSNKLNGTLPESIGRLEKLKMLVIYNNSLKGVVSEVHFANLTRLSYLDARDNEALTLKPSVRWVPPFQLAYMRLRSWNLGPQFPAWLQSQRNLYALDIASTGISDIIPTWVFNISYNLRYLNLSHNQIQGNVPSVLNFNSSIFRVAVDLSSNHFNGPLPRISSNVDFLDLSNNSFSGSLHHFACDKVIRVRMLTILNLGNNLLSGEIPDCWMNWEFLFVMKLAGNNLMGSIPSSIGNLSLLSLNMRKNNLSGKLPTGLMNSKELMFIDLAENKFIGSIPAWVGERLTELKVLNLHSNKFWGDIPHELCRLTSLQILDLAHNNLSGNIPRCFNNFSVMTVKDSPTDSFSHTSNAIDPGEVQDTTSLVTKGREDEYDTILHLVTSMDLSCNNLSGEIPDELMSLVGLRSLNVSENHLTGRIPEKIGEMRRLESLDFSTNQLFGEIPSGMASLTFLSRLNLSFNNLTGKILSSVQLQTLDESSFIGNRLCGPPLTESCDKHEEEPDVESTGEEGDEGVDWPLIIGMIIGFIVSFWVVLGPLIVSMSWRIAYFHFLDEIWYKLCDVIRKYCCKTPNN